MLHVLDGANNGKKKPIID